jgi:hypothetical protein
MSKMIKFEDILSLTEFRRHTKKHMARLHTTGRPEVLTVNGKAKLIVQDAVAYQRLIEQAAPLGKQYRVRPGQPAFHGSQKPADFEK